MAGALGFFDAAPASSSSEEEEEEVEEAAETAAPAPAPAPAAPAVPPAAPKVDAAGAKRKRAPGALPSPDEAAALVGGTASYIFTGTDAEAEAEPAGFYSGGGSEAKVAAAAHIGVEQSRTVETPDSTVGFLLAGGGKQIKALEDATGCRVVVDREGRGGRDAAHRASADAQTVRKVTLIGDETALREGERRLHEMVLASGKNVVRTIRCTPNQAGALIGRGGAVIKRLQSATSTLINVSGRDDASSGDADAPRTVTITGPSWNVELASRFVFASMRDPAELGALIADAEAAQASGAGGGGGGKAAHAGSGYGDAAAFAAVYGSS